MANYLSCMVTTDEYKLWMMLRTDKDKEIELMRTLAVKYDVKWVEPPVEEGAVWEEDEDEDWSEPLEQPVLPADYPFVDEEGYDIKCCYCNARWCDTKTEDGVWFHKDCE